MESNGKELTALEQVLQKLGSKNTVVQDTISKLAANGIKVSRSVIYRVIAGENARREKQVVDTFLEVAEAEFTRRRGVEDRARQLVAQA